MNPTSTPQPKKHRYKRRTWDEAFEIARAKFRAEVSAHLPSDELQQLKSIAAADMSLVLGGGPVYHPDSWRHLTSVIPDRDGFYEVLLYEATPYDGAPSPKIWARILVSRDHDSDLCVVDWHPVQDTQDNDRNA